MSPSAVQSRLESYLRAVARMQRALSEGTSPELRQLTHVLAPLGRASGASRVYLFENHRDEDGLLRMSQRAEWCAPGVVPEIDNPELQGLSYDGFFPRWAEVLAAGGTICAVVAEMPAGEREVLEGQSILSILVVPLHVQGHFIGFIGFDDCLAPRRWDELEIELLSAAASNIGLFLDQRRVRLDLERANQDLTAARDEVLLAMKARSVFLGKVSHELRTPLNAIIGYGELVLDELGDASNADLEEDVQRILGSGRYLLSMVDDLLTLTQLGTGEAAVHARPVAVDRWLDELLQMWLHPRSDVGVAVEVDRAGPLGEVVTDPRRLQQVVVNLLSNATKYTKEGQVFLRVAAQEDGLSIAVEDTGIGIPEAALEHIFDEFYQVSSPTTTDTRGVGLGLPITQKLCDALGAKLHVRSEVGVGSTFSVLLPRQ